MDLRAIFDFILAWIITPFLVSFSTIRCIEGMVNYLKDPKNKKAKIDIHIAFFAYALIFFCLARGIFIHV